MIIMPFQWVQSTPVCSCSCVSLEEALPVQELKTPVALPEVGSLQEESVALANVGKEGNWIIAAIRVLFLLHALGMTCASFGKAVESVKRVILGGPDGPEFNGRELFSRSVGLAMNVASLCVWADRVHLISLGRAASPLRTAYYTVEFLRRIVLVGLAFNSTSEIWRKRQSSGGTFRRYKQQSSARFAGRLALVAHHSIGVLHACSGIGNAAQNRVPYPFVRNLEFCLWATGIVQAASCSFFERTRRRDEEVVVDFYS